jgi:hypothetical protein
MAIPIRARCLSMNCWTSWPGANTMMGSPFKADQVVEVRRKVGSLSGRITIREKRNRGVRRMPEAGLKNAPRLISSLPVSTIWVASCGAAVEWAVQPLGQLFAAHVPDPPTLHRRELRNQHWGPCNRRVGGAVHDTTSQHHAWYQRHCQTCIPGWHTRGARLFSKFGREFLAPRAATHPTTGLICSQGHRISKWLKRVVITDQFAHPTQATVEFQSGLKNSNVDRSFGGTADWVGDPRQCMRAQVCPSPPRPDSAPLRSAFREHACDGSPPLSNESSRC